MGTIIGLRHQLLAMYHGSLMGGHFAINGTHIKLKRHFYWPEMLIDVVKWIKGCNTCARCKHENVASLGLLQPLPIPSQPW